MFMYKILIYLISKIENRPSFYLQSSQNWKKAQDIARGTDTWVSPRPAPASEPDLGRID